MKNVFQEIFKENPTSWGLRGDPYMWEELRSHMTNIGHKFTVKEFDNYITGFFINFLLANGKKVGEDIYHVRCFPAEGMSGGKVSMVWWQEIAKTELIVRYNKAIK